MNIRKMMKDSSVIRNTYYGVLYVKNFIKSFFAKLRISLFCRREAMLLKELRPKVVNLFSSKANLTNPRFFSGKNILGYPAMGFLLKDGKPVGWEKSRLTKNGSELTIMQLLIDWQTNFPRLFNTYKPEILVDFGTASGGTAVLFYDLMSAYSKPQILSIDISDHDYKASADFHLKNSTALKAKFVFGKSTLACYDEVKDFLAQRGPDQKVMFSFDDNHEYEHTYSELKLFSPLLRSGDVILMQDTWNQGLFGHEVSPMLAVHRFLKETESFQLDTEFNASLTLPCNFVYGVLVKK